MTTWRYIAQRATTGDFLELEVPFVTRSELTWSLSAAGSLKGSISPDVGSLKAQDGRPMFEEWNTLLYAEADGEIRWGGIVITSEPSSDGKSWEIEAASFATYPNGIPYLGAYYGVKVDPADVVRELWAHVQGFARGDLGVTVTGATSARIGSDSEQKYNAAKAVYEAAKATYEDEKDYYTALRKRATELGQNRTSKNSDKSAAGRTLSTAKSNLSAAKSALVAAKKTKDPAKIATAQTAVNNAQTAVNNAQAAYNGKVSIYEDAKGAYNAADRRAGDQDKVRDAAKKVQDDAKKKMDAAKKVMDEDGGAYKMLWWEAPDAGAKIKSLASDTPFDFTETHSWNGSKTGITHRVNVQYPRAGARRTDLKFVQGDNIIDVPVPKSNGDDYANSVFLLGAGEGKGMRKTTTSIDDGRLRRVEVVNAKDVKNTDSLRAISRNALIQAQATTTIEQISVRNHPHALIGSWALGDDILVEAEVPFIGRVRIWHRIIAWSLTSDSTATLKLARSDSFTYGK